MPLPPPPDPLTKQLESALLTLKSTVGTLKLYPAASPICQQSLQGCHQPIRTYLENIPEVTINVTDTGLAIDGNKPITVKGLRELLMVHTIRNLKFLRGVTPEEICILCEGLGKKKEDLATHKDFDAWLTSRNSIHIHTDETRYINVEENEKVVIRGRGQFSADGPTGVTQSAKDSLNQISQIPDATLQEALRDGLVKDVSQLTPEKLQEIMTSRDAESGPLADMMQDVMRTLPIDKIEEILRYVAEKQHQIKIQVQSQSDQAQRIGLLKTFMRQVMSAPASREIPPQLYSYLASLGLLEHTQGTGLKTGQYFSFTAVAQNLMELPSAFLVTQPLSDHVLELVKNLCARSNVEALKELLKKVLENLDNFDDKLRGFTVGILAKMHAILSTQDQTEVGDQLMQAVTKLVETERSLETYKLTIAALQSIAMDQLLHARYEKAASILGQLRRHSQETFAMPQGRFEHARQGLRQFGLRAVEALCTDINTSEGESQRGALKVLVQLGNEGVEPLLDMLKRVTNAKAQQAVLQALELLGPVANKILLERLEVGAPAKTLVQLIPLVAPFASPAVLSRIAPLLQHPTGNVRREALIILEKIKDPKVPGLILNLVNDPDPLVQEIVIRSIGTQRPPDALDVLVNKLKTAPAALQEVICVTLGSLGNPTAIPVLALCLCGRSGFMSKTPLYEENVRIRAASSLGCFLPDSKAHHALESAAHDPSPLVQQTAHQVLSNRT